ncbi:hypothetical protein HUT16_15255 [Kitasatospora sp. NA04385]|uniref:hypothetical protein n=1 Tax=Kitasatospora sp. NA04385 TaxID=2742135 RepID=UPI0015914E6D|nr:hypothetical protein [Kitasatospora sp. NA04385]QKW20242.1 hypothetical protein HUT16_15255 [Kitasatospora sp. NA04385]
MSTNRSRRIDRAVAEQLLGGVTVDPEAGQDPSAGQRSAPGRPELAALLAAAAGGAAGDGPLPGEEGALAAFRQARRQPAPRQHRRRKMADTALARALSAKAVAVALGVTAVGGVAVAASTGRLPEVLGGPAPAPPATSAAPAPSSAEPSPAAPSSASPGADRTGRPSPSPSRSGSPARPTGRASGDPSDPSGLPDLSKLCAGFAGRIAGGSKPGEAAVDPDLAELLKAAGAPEKVTGFCALLAAHGWDQPGGDGRGRPTAVPSRPSSPSPSSSGKWGRQSARPSGGGNSQD